jgi:zinc transport system ATP-binding protein
LLKALIGEIPYSGNVEFLDAQGAIHAKPRIGYVPQSPRFEKGFPITVLDLFAASLSKYPVWLGVRASMRQRVGLLLKRVEAEHLLDRKVGALSGGELQRVLLALALEPKPNLLFLDEPVSGMDANGRRLFFEVVDRLRRTMDLSVILVTHDFQEIASVADRMVLLNGAVLCSGKPQDIFAHPSFQEIFGGGVLV